MKEKILCIIPETEFTDEQREWLSQLHEVNNPLFERVHNDYSYVRINSELYHWESDLMITVVDWLNDNNADKSLDEAQLQALVELILNRDLQPNEIPYIEDALALWCINYEDFDDIHNIVSNIVRQYAVCSDAEPVYSCLVPAQLALFLMTASSSQINSFWDSLRTEMSNMIILVNTIQKHVDLK